MTTKIAVDPVVETLRKARQELVTRGWIQGVGMSVNGRICLGYALKIANDAPNANYEAAKAMAFTSFSGMVMWNDEPGRTFDQMLERIDSAIARQLGVPAL